MLSLFCYIYFTKFYYKYKNIVQNKKIANSTKQTEYFIQKRLEKKNTKVHKKRKNTNLLVEFTRSIIFGVNTYQKNMFF